MKTSFGQKVRWPSFIESTSCVHRYSGVDFLSQIISQCPTDRINRQASKYNRYKSWSCFSLYVSQGFSLLLRWKAGRSRDHLTSFERHFDSHNLTYFHVFRCRRNCSGVRVFYISQDLCANHFISRLFEHADMKSLLQSGRYNVFQILDSLLARHRQGMFSDFFRGLLYLQCEYSSSRHKRRVSCRIYLSCRRRERPAKPHASVLDGSGYMHRI